MLFGVIDIGSTSVRLMMTDGEKVEKRVNTTRLAENMDEMNTLQPVSIERTAQAVAEYYFVAMQNGAEGYLIKLGVLPHGFRAIYQKII